jgi:hypothetical protein
MNLEVQVGLAQAFIAVFSLVATPFIAFAYRDFVSKRGHGIECLARPLEEGYRYSKTWMITLYFAKYAGKNGPLIILPSQVGNKVYKLKQVREIREVDFVLNVNSDCAEVNTRSIPKRSSISFLLDLKKMIRHLFILMGFTFNVNYGIVFSFRVSIPAKLKFLITTCLLLIGGQSG